MHPDASLSPHTPALCQPALPIGQGAEPSASKRFEHFKIVGKGAYSVVASATDTTTGEKVAIKRINEVFYDTHEAKKVLREIRLLRVRLARAKRGVTQKPQLEPKLKLEPGVFSLLSRNPSPESKGAAASCSGTQQGPCLFEHRYMEDRCIEREERSSRCLNPMQDFHHPHIIALKALIYPSSIDTFDTIFMVTDCMEMDLRKWIKSKVAMAPSTVRSYMAQLLSALHHVHSIGGVHRDLKPANILINRRGDDLKLCDFGLARTIDDADSPCRGACDTAPAIQSPEPSELPGTLSRRRSFGIDVDLPEEDEEEPSSDGALADGALPVPPPLRHQMTQYVVTRWYRAPEVILKEPYSSPIDMWSVGCVFKELLELMPDSQYCTGALFPGRHCLPFSFGEDRNFRQRHDQLAVIFRVLSAPTQREMSWASLEGQADVEQVISRWCEHEKAEREAQIRRHLSRTCPVASETEVDLLAQLLNLHPGERLRADKALEHAYFAELPVAMRTPVAVNADKAKLEAAFAFELEVLQPDDLRLLISNDLFRMQPDIAGAQDVSARDENQDAPATKGYI